MASVNFVFLAEIHYDRSMWRLQASRRTAGWIPVRLARDTPRRGARNSFQLLWSTSELRFSDGSEAKALWERHIQLAYRVSDALCRWYGRRRWVLEIEKPGFIDIPGADPLTCWADEALEERRLALWHTWPCNGPALPASEAGDGMDPLPANRIVCAADITDPTLA